ncbi:MAG TPA: LamG-like jellyroll fold domain-containing protein, partial [Flavisolibacter sp.]
ADGWATLLTGTTSSKHNITSEDFSGHRLADYPTLFTRLKTERPTLRTVAITASQALATNLAADAAKKETPGSDAAVKDAAVNELKTGDPDLLMVQFSSVDEAGKTGGYSASVAGYKDAILQVDAYIGDILTAMRNRSGFANENWLVLITSNKGSNLVYTPPTGAQWNAFNDANHNTFFINYNPRIVSQNPAKPSTIIPYVGTTPLYVDQAASRSRVLNPQTNIDMGASGGYTIQCKVKIPPGGYYYPAILGKRNSFDGGQVGWVFFLEGNVWMINMSQAGAGNRQVAGGVVADNQWHTLTAVVRQEGTQRNVYVYTDGVPSTGRTNIADWGDMSSPAPLTAGFIPGSRFGGSYSPNNFRITDIRLYNTALSAEYIAANFCKTDVPADDPYRDNLLGFWPATSVSPDKQMPDLSGKNNPMTVDSYNPGSFSDITSTVCPSISESIYLTVPNSVDVVFQIYQWLGVIAPPAWSLDGKSWVPSYSDVKG